MIVPALSTCLHPSGCRRMPNVGNLFCGLHQPRHAPVRVSSVRVERAVQSIAAEVDRTVERRRAAPSTARTRDRCACGRDESHPSAWLEPRGRGLLLFCPGCADGAAVIPTKGR